MTINQEARNLAKELFVEHHVSNGSANYYAEAKAFVESLPVLLSDNVAECGKLILEGLKLIHDKTPKGVKPVGQTETRIYELMEIFFTRDTIQVALLDLLQKDAIYAERVGTGSRWHYLAL